MKRINPGFSKGGFRGGAEKTRPPSLTSPLLPSTTYFIRKILKKGLVDYWWFYRTPSPPSPPPRPPRASFQKLRVSLPFPIFSGISGFVLVHANLYTYRWRHKLTLKPCDTAEFPGVAGNGVPSLLGNSLVLGCSPPVSGTPTWVKNGLVGKKTRTSWPVAELWLELSRQCLNLDWNVLS